LEEALGLQDLLLYGIDSSYAEASISAVHREACPCNHSVILSVQLPSQKSAFFVLQVEFQKLLFKVLWLGSSGTLTA